MYKNFREEQEKSSERSLLEAKILDKYKFAVTKNKITNTDFLNLSEKSFAEKILKEKKILNSVFFGGNGEDSDRNILIFYPEKFSVDIVEKNYDKIMSVIKINLPKELEYEHRTILGAIMKLGVKREKIGDIFVKENCAEIVVLNEICDFLINNLKQLTRFRKAEFEVISINDLEKFEKEFENLSIIVNSMRLDNFVSELAKSSRSKSEEIIKEQRVLVNYELETKGSRKINLEDVITIRGKGKFIVSEIERKTKNDKLVISLKKFV